MKTEVRKKIDLMNKIKLPYTLYSIVQEDTINNYELSEKCSCYYSKTYHNQKFGVYKFNKIL